MSEWIWISTFLTSTWPSVIWPCILFLFSITHVTSSILALFQIPQPYSQEPLLLTHAALPQEAPLLALWLWVSAQKILTPEVYSVIILHLKQPLTLHPSTIHQRNTISLPFVVPFRALITIVCWYVSLFFGDVSLVRFLIVYVTSLIC